MDKFVKVFWLWLSVTLIIVCIVGTLYVSDKYNVNHNNLANQIQFYDSKKKELSTQKKSLISIRDSLFSQLSVEKGIEQKKMLELQLDRIKIKEEKEKQIKEQKRIKEERARLEELRRQEERARLEELRRQEEIRQKSKKRKRRRSRAS